MRPRAIKTSLWLLALSLGVANAQAEPDLDLIWDQFVKTCTQITTVPLSVAFDAAKFVRSDDRMAMISEDANIFFGTGELDLDTEFDFLLATLNFGGERSPDAMNTFCTFQFLFDDPDIHFGFYELAIRRAAEVVGPNMITLGGQLIGTGGLFERQKNPLYSATFLALPHPSPVMIRVNEIPRSVALSMSRYLPTKEN